MIYNKTMSELIPAPKKAPKELVLGSVKLALPALIADEGRPTTKRFIEFFTAHIRNANTREAYGRAVRDFFAWCDEHQVWAADRHRSDSYRELHRAAEPGKSATNRQTTIGRY